MKKLVMAFGVLVVLGAGAYNLVTKVNLNTEIEIGTVVDSFNGVDVYFNGGVNHVLERNVSVDGYNLGLKYQCVEFVKRYYYELFQHKMPDSYGHAKDFFDAGVISGSVNVKRGLLQFTNGQGELPQVSDILVYQPTLYNPYGHVAIVAHVDLEGQKVEIIQQNPGPFSESREVYAIAKNDDGYFIDHRHILGWLRKMSEV